MRFDLTDLKLFLHVVEAGSITAGADRMHLAVAAASTRIRNMELELGTPLLNRERQGVHPTPAGRTLVHHARVLLQQAERMRGGMYWSGDLAYRDADGWVYFAGRSGGWLRVDGENLASAPIERILLRHPAISEAAVYGVPDRVGDKVVYALILRAELTADELWTFLAEQSDLSPKAWPSAVRILEEIPRTATNKIIVRALRELPADWGETWAPASRRR